VSNTPDFYRPGHTYTGKYGWKFRCDVITTHPEDGERTALGWRFFNGSWEAYAYGEDDWGVHNHPDDAGTDLWIVDRGCSNADRSHWGE
jgi:hypothetical protein